MEAALLFSRWHAIPALHVENATDALIAKHRKHSFGGCTYWSRLATVEPNRAHHCQVDSALFTQQYFTRTEKV